jgi:hypothetical protein
VILTPLPLKYTEVTYHSFEEMSIGLFLRLNLPSSFTGKDPPLSPQRRVFADKFC